LALRRQLTFLFLFTFWHTMFSILFYDTGLLTRLNLGPGVIRFITIYLQVIGIPSAIMRLSEPFVWANLQMFVARLLGRKSNALMELSSTIEPDESSKIMVQQLRDASICSFLNSTMNMEYVYFILQGIDKLLANQQMLDSISRKHN
jgi:hypothetical protein